MAIETIERRGKPEGLHHIGPAVREVERRILARNGHNPLWERVKRGFEREWLTPWDSMDGLQRGIVRVMYKHEKKEASKPKPEIKPVEVRNGFWTPVSTSSGK